MQIIKEGDINKWLFLVNVNARICIKSCVTLLFKISFKVLFQKTENAILQNAEEFVSNSFLFWQH